MATAVEATPGIEDRAVNFVRDLTSSLTVKDAQIILQTIRNQTEFAEMAHLCMERLSVANYFQTYFVDYIQILRSMSKNLVYLAGLRSIAFFAPMHLGSDSYWEFYIHKDDHCIRQFLTDMHEIGVNWYSPIDELKTYLKEGDGCLRINRQLFEVHGDKIYKLIKSSQYESANIESLFQLLQADYTVDAHLLISGGSISVTYSPPGESPIHRIVQGTIKTRYGVDHPISLSILNTNYPIDVSILLSARCSALSFICAHFACDPYGHITANHLFFLWEDDGDDIVDDLVLHNFRKDDTLMPRAQEFREVCREDSVVVPQPSVVGEPQGIVEYYRNLIRSNIWYQTGNSLVPAVRGAPAPNVPLAGWVTCASARHSKPPEWLLELEKSL